MLTQPGRNPMGPNGKPLMRVCVLVSSYEGSNSDMADFDNIPTTPAHFFPPTEGAPPCDPADKYEYVFDRVPLLKKDVFATVRRLVKSGDYDVFFNLCDGCQDEDRAGIEVVTTLEQFNAPFTGSNAKYYEVTKPNQKMWAYYQKILTPKHAVVDRPEDIRRKCRNLTFPVIVKHQSGYSSVGMTKDCRCEDMDALVARATKFIAQYQFALIEEFIIGDEVTVLACADPSQPDGIRVYPPVIMRFPKGEDFKHFDLKWTAYEDLSWSVLPEDHPSYDRVVSISRRSFQIMMGGVGYGRTDLRLHHETGDPYFLEINTNCGIMYPPDQEGSADWILRLTQSHQAFTKLQIDNAISVCRKNTPVIETGFDEAEKNGYYIFATVPIPKGTVIFHDEGKSFRLYTKQYAERNMDQQMKEWFQTSAWPLSPDQHVYAIWDTEPANWRPFNHSCDPNMTFAPDRSLNVITVRDIRPGEELTMDYADFCDSTMPNFDCTCGSAVCRKRIVLEQVPAQLKPTSWHWKCPGEATNNGPLTPVTSPVGRSPPKSDEDIASPPRESCILQPSAGGGGSAASSAERPRQQQEAN